MNHQHRHGFTLIEILAITSVIIILIGITVGVGLRALSRSANVRKTQSILATIRLGLNQAMAEGRTIAPVTHPSSTTVTTLPVHRMSSAGGNKCMVLVNQAGANTSVFEWLFGPTNTLAELRSLGAIYTYVPSGGYVAPYYTASVPGDDSPGRLQGMYLYDAWGTEICAYQHTVSKEIVLLSAGPTTYRTDVCSYFGKTLADGGSTTLPSTTSSDVLRFADNIIDGAQVE